MGAFHRILFSPLLILLHVTLVVHATRVSLKINIGGGQVGGFLAESDVLEVEKSMPRTQYRGNIDSETEDSDVFRTQRFTRHEDLVLHVPVADGIYDVTLLFAETWKGSFQEDARVFYVFLGSKPNGVVRVLENLDPYKSVGEATPLRRKFKNVMSKDGITVALRPKKQNPQIAGIVIEGHAYPETHLKTFTTVENEGPVKSDMSILESIRPRLPEDISILYDPLDNPKYLPLKLEKQRRAKEESRRLEEVRKLEESRREEEARGLEGASRQTETGSLLDDARRLATSNSEKSMLNTDHYGGDATNRADAVQMTNEVPRIQQLHPSGVTMCCDGPVSPEVRGISAALAEELNTSQRNESPEKVDSGSSAMINHPTQTEHKLDAFARAKKSIDAGASADQNTPVMSERRGTFGVNIDDVPSEGSLCINNESYCTCGVSASRPPGECLFVENEQAQPMICRKDLCKHQLLCACAPGANRLCRKTKAHSILIEEVQEHQSKAMFVHCRREEVKDGVPALEEVI